MFKKLYNITRTVIITLNQEQLLSNELIEHIIRQFFIKYLKFDNKYFILFKVMEYKY